MNLKVLITIFLSTTFFIIGVLTLPKYGINWDTINHLPRGQAYLHYFLTGKKDYSDLPAFVHYWQKPESLAINADIPKDQVRQRSFYQSDATTFNWFIENDGNGHPPLSDVLSAIFNHLFFQQFGLINDIDAYRVYGIFLASCLVALVFWWSSASYGKLAGLVAVLSLATYPLFWSEAHFNIEKDIPETVFISFLLFSYWQAVRKHSVLWYFLAGLAFGLALGTKFNVFFSLFIIFPWFIGSMFFEYFNNFKKRYLARDFRMFFFGSALVVLLGVFIFFLSWPYLWADPLSRVLDVANYYKVIGTTQSIDSRFVGPFGINTYPVKWILYTTPPVVLFLFALGLISALINLISRKDRFSLLLLLWVTVPVLRVTWPGTTIYGGVRQIMEYTPAMAILAGLGASQLITWLGGYIVSFRRPISYLTVKHLQVILPLLFVPHLLMLIQLHPNENVYFNFLVEGLPGAKKVDLPSWGNTFGAAYRQGVVWLNANTPPGAKVVMVRELKPNIPTIWLRPDISYHNSQRSGYLQLGEYAMGLTYQGTKDSSYYDGFLETFVRPRYEVSVDSVGILKIWENDKSQLTFGLKEKFLEKVVLEKLDSGLRFDLGKEYSLSRLEVHYKEGNCQPLSFGVARISPDGKNWQNMVGVLPKYWKISMLGQQPANGKFIEPFYGQNARYIDLILSPVNTCLKNVLQFKIYYYDF